MEEKVPERKDIGRLPFEILFIPLLFFFFIGTSGAQEDSLPSSLGPLRLEQFQSGEEAKQEIDRLHGKTIRFQKGYVGIYTDPKGQGRLWVSQHATREEAANTIRKMAERIEGAKEGPFWHFQRKEIEGLNVYFVVGMGQAHYFFQKGGRVLWLAVDPSFAKEAIRDLVKKTPH